MNPSLRKRLFPEFPIHNERFEVTTAHQTTTHNGFIITPPWKKIIGESEQQMKFYLFNFSNNYDVLFGSDLLRQTGLVVDLKSNILLGNKINIELNMLSEDALDIDRLCDEYNDLFTEEVTSSATTSIKHEIKLLDESPIYQRPYRLPQVQREEVKNHINKLLQENIIRHSDSPWASPVHLVPKKLDASGKPKWRMVIDFRKLNEQTRSDKYPLPNIEDIFSQINDSKIFSTLDLTSGYHQIMMDKDSIEKTAFVTPDGHFEYLRMPFGLKNAPATFQRLMNNTLRDYIGKICLVYLDDIIVFAKTPEDHLARLRLIFNALRKANLKLNKNKCEFGKESIEFLGHTITKEGIKPSQSKIKAILNFPIPKTVKQIKSFLGLVGYYRKFIPNMSSITKPLTKCTKKDTKINANDPAYLKAFEDCKQLLINAPILQYPDFNKDFTLTTDASDKALGAVLTQSGHPIGYASRTLSETEQKYNTTEKELLGIIWACQQFRPYIYGRKFYIETDHQPLVWLSKLKEPNAKLTRWKLKLQEYDFEIKHKKGAENRVADALSRIQIFHNSDDNRSVCVNTSDDESDNETVHSNSDNSDKGIPIKNKFAHSRMNRLFIEPGSHYSVRKDNRDIHACVPYTNFDNYAFKLLRDYLGKPFYAVVTNDEKTYQLLSECYRKNFDPKQLRLVRYNKNLNEITDPEKQYERIHQLHLKDKRHLGSDKMIRIIKEKYYWPKIPQQVLRYVKNCTVCAKEKYKRHPLKPAFENTETPTEPLQIWNIDVYHYDGKGYLTMIDRFSKWACVRQLSSTNTQTALDVLIELICMTGKPSKITHDSDPIFTSALFKEALNQLNIELHKTSPAHHTSNSDVERFHSTLREILGVMKHEHDKQTPTSRLMMYSLYAYNNTQHDTTGFTPYEIHFGRKSTSIEPDDSLIYQEYTQQHKNLREKLYRQVFDKMTAIKQKVISKLNQDRQNITLKIGQAFYIKNHDAERNKTKSKYLGPFTVKRLLEHNIIEYVGKKNQLRTIHLEETFIPDATTQKANSPQLIAPTPSSTKGKPSE